MKINILLQKAYKTVQGVVVFFDSAVGDGLGTIPCRVAKRVLSDLFSFKLFTRTEREFDFLFGTGPACTGPGFLVAAIDFWTKNMV